MTSEVEERPRLVTSGYGRHRRQWVNKGYLEVMQCNAKHCKASEALVITYDIWWYSKLIGTTGRGNLPKAEFRSAVYHVKHVLWVWSLCYKHGSQRDYLFLRQVSSVPPNYLAFICCSLLWSIIKVAILSFFLATFIILHKRLGAVQRSYWVQDLLVQYRWSLWSPRLQQNDQTRKHMLHMIYRWPKFCVLRSAFSVRHISVFAIRQITLQLVLLYITLDSLWSYFYSQNYLTGFLGCHLQTEVFLSHIVANEPAEWRRSAGEAAENSAVRRMLYAKKFLIRGRKCECNVSVGCKNVVPSFSQLQGLNYSSHYSFSQSGVTLHLDLLG